MSDAIFQLRVQRYVFFGDYPNFFAENFCNLLNFRTFVPVMLEKTRCIVLRTVKYGDHSLIIDLLTREVGRLSVVWRMPKTGKGKTKRQIFQILNILDVYYESRSANSLPMVKEAHIVEPYSSIPFDSVKLSVSFFIAEFLCFSTRAEQTDYLLYDFIENSLKWYDTSVSAPANFHLMFMIKVSRFLGFYPNLEEFTEHSYFDLRAGQFTGEAPCHSDFLKPSETHDFINLMRMTPENMHLFRLSHSERNRIINVMMQFYGFHIPGFKELKSLEVLREIFK